MKINCIQYDIQYIDLNSVSVMTSVATNSLSIYLHIPNEPKTCGGIPRASSNACKRPTSGSSASGSMDAGAELPKLTGSELLAPLPRLWAKLTFANASVSLLNVTAELADNVDG